MYCQTYSCVCCFIRGNESLCVALFYWLICFGMKGSQQILREAGTGGLLKINCNNKGRGSRIIRFYVLENTV